MVEFVLVEIDIRRCLIEFPLRVVENVANRLVNWIVDVLVVEIIALDWRRPLIIVVLLVRREVFVSAFATCWTAIVIVI